jgi:hypothetical protein
MMVLRLGTAVGSDIRPRDRNRAEGARVCRAGAYLWRCMSDSAAIDPDDAFWEWMRPTVEALRAFTTAVDEVALRHASIPASDSQAMRELAAENDYRSQSSWQNPITDTHTFGAMTLRAVADNVSTFATAFSGEHPPLYGHLVVARSALEASVVSAWLNEPGIAYLDRIKRGMCERLYSANEVKKLWLTPDAAEKLAEIKANAANFGWDTRFGPGGKPVVDETKRPSVGDGITRLLVDDSQAQIGKLLWNRLSAVTHVTWWGLEWAIHLPEGELGNSGFTTVSVGADSTKVAIQALCILRALRLAASHRVTLMGWNDETWQADCRHAEEHERTLFQAATPRTT